MPVRINWPMLTATVCPNIGGWIGGYITRKNISWYEVRILHASASARLPHYRDTLRNMRNRLKENVL